MKNNLISLMVALVIGVMCVGTLLAPTITALTEETRTVYNDGATFTLADSEDETAHTLILGNDGDGNIQITLDGEICENPDFTHFGSASVLIAENTFIRLEPSGVVRLCGSNGNTSHTYINIGSCLIDGGVTFTITGDSAVYTYSDVDYTVSSVLAYISDTGDYRMSKNPHVLEDSPIFAGAYNTLSGSSIGVVLYGTLDDITSTAVYPGGRAIGDITLHLSNVCSNLYTLDNMDVECMDGIISIGTMYVSYLVVPYEIVYENPEYVGSSLAPIMLAITTITVIGLVVVASRGITRD